MQHTLDHKTLQRLAPAAFSEDHPNSERYAHIRTMDMVERLRELDFVPVAARQDAPRCRDKRYVSHAITLRQNRQVEIGGAQLPQLTIVNSHNGRNKMRLHGGLFRLVCSNGLMVGRETMRHDVRHSGTEAQDLALDFSERLVRHLTNLSGTIEAWQHKQLSRSEREEFARQAAQLRFANSAYEPETLLAPRRAEDDHGDLWSVYNVVQENTMRGGLVGVSANGRAVRSKPLTSIGADISYNERLWQLAESFA